MKLAVSGALLLGTVDGANGKPARNIENDLY